MIRTWVCFKMEYTPKLVISKGNIVINHDNQWMNWDLVVSDKAIQEKISKNLDKKHQKTPKLWINRGVV